MADDNRRDGNSDGKPPPYTPYLKIRYELGDLNQPRSTLPPGTDFWASPDITFSPTDPLGNVIAGVPTTITVTVFNWGLSAAAPTAVDFFWANPSLAIAAGNVNQINTAPVLVTVPGQNSVTVTCPDQWVPTFVNGGHECLIVQAGCPADPVTDPLHPQFDRHVAQRNLTVSAPAEMMQFQLRADNPFDEASTFQLHHTAAALRADFDGRDRDAILGLVTASDPGRFDPTLTRVDVSNEVAFRLVGREVVRGGRVQLEPKPDDRARMGAMDEGVVARGAGQSVLTRLQQGPDYRPGERGLPIAELELGPGESVILTLRARSSAGANTSIVHQFTQVIDGCEVGGYTVFEPSTEIANLWRREADALQPG